MNDLHQRHKVKTTLKDIVREKIACRNTDYRTAYTDILKDWPRNRKQPSFETVRRYFRQFEEKAGPPSPQTSDAQAEHPSHDDVAESNGSRKQKETITVGCHLPNVLKLAAQESLTIATVLQMGLLPVLKRLAKRGRELNDPELNELLALLSLVETPDKERNPKMIDRTDLQLLLCEQIMQMDTNDLMKLASEITSHDLELADEEKELIDGSAEPPAIVDGDGLKKWLCFLLDALGERVPQDHAKG
jgi:hypothetical protein